MSCRFFETTKAHDTVYALLAIAKDTSPVAVNPGFSSEDTEPVAKVKNLAKLFTFRAKRYNVDYNLPSVDICQEFIQFAIDQTVDKIRAIDVICRPWAHVEKNLSLPSWIPSLACAPFGMYGGDRGLKMGRKNGNPLVGLPTSTQRNYNPALGKAADANILRFKKRRNCHSMFVSDFILDTIDQLEDASQLGNIPEDWLVLGGCENTSEDPPGEFWRTIMADRGDDGENPPYTAHESGGRRW